MTWAVALWHWTQAVVELSLSSWLVAGVVPGVECQPLKKLKAEPAALFELLQRWRLEAERSGRKITRIAVAGRDGFWLARWISIFAVRWVPFALRSMSPSRDIFRRMIGARRD